MTGPRLRQPTSTRHISLPAVGRSPALGPGAPSRPQLCGHRLVSPGSPPMATGRGPHPTARTAPTPCRQSHTGPPLRGAPPRRKQGQVGGKWEEALFCPMPPKHTHVRTHGHIAHTHAPHRHTHTTHMCTPTGTCVHTDPPLPPGPLLQADEPPPGSDPRDASPPGEIGRRVQLGLGPERESPALLEVPPAPPRPAVAPGGRGKGSGPQPSAAPLQAAPKALCPGWGAWFGGGRGHRLAGGVLGRRHSRWPPTGSLPGPSAPCSWGPAHGRSAFPSS